MANLPQVSYAACATGDTDVIISVRARNINELYDFVIETLGKIPGVRHTRTIPLPIKMKSVVRWMPPDVFEGGEGNSSQDTLHAEGN
jgi:DNA-binding Lrp family transcriptional regulator